MYCFTLVNKIYLLTYLLCTKRLKERTPRRFVSILISSAMAKTDGDIELNGISYLFFERKTPGASAGVN